MERAQRRIIVQYPKRQQGNKMYGGESSHLPLKLNTAGVIPPIFASSLLLMPVTIANFGGSSDSEWLNFISAYLGHGQPLYLAFYLGMIVFFCFFYTAIVFNPEETADNLKRYGGFVPGIRPGKNTATYLDYVLTPVDGVGRRLSFGGLSLTRITNFSVRGTVLFRRHKLADRGQRDNGYCGADPVTLACASV